MMYSFPCECGHSITVSATAAGSEVACQCGRSQVVPPLSTLRVMAGRGAYEVGTIDTIRRMIRDGELPGGQICVVSGVPTTDTAILRIQCERVWVTTSRSPFDAADRAFIGFLIFGWIGALVGWACKGKPQQEHGRETYIDVPLRVAEDQIRVLQNESQAKLKRLLSEVPIYEQLLLEFPEAVVAAKKTAY